MTGLERKISALHAALSEARIPHAFGGALALAWCTERARGTIDIDLNVFVETSAFQTVLDALPRGVRWSPEKVELLQRDGQVRIHWGDTPIDLFLNTTAFHEGVASRAVLRPFRGDDVPFLCCTDLAVFKAFFNRTKDWADLEEMAAAGTLDIARTVGVLTDHLGADDDRIERLRRLAPH
ncbi:MAG: hypothetical protein JWM89_1163 [Acidimicrobiales bacterium]|nr:hypothetical protein [Acidimicrobiales bacterium]